MRISLRRHLFPITICIPIIWFLVTLLILQLNDLPKTSDIDKQSFKIENTTKHSQFNVNPRHAINLIKKIIKYKPKTEVNHIIHDKREQLIAPDVDGKKSDLNAPGEMGKAVIINKTNLLPDDAKKYDDGFQNNAFNAYASDLISMHRSLPDVRDAGCRKLQYKSPRVTASVVMCFHNEAWSVLLRSIHSILDRSPLDILKEIILVDDFSDLEHLKSPLNDYVKNLKIVSIIRQPKREGLIRSRLAGAAAVKSDVIVFLDSHIEATEGWLEPLLDPISQNYTTVVTPIIDVIDDTTFQYNAGTSGYISVGGFDWNLQFNWHGLPEREKKLRQHPLEPARSPTMAGGLFAISRRYFNDLGTYDGGMDIWGGENLEMSFRIWMCGGTLLTVPCSHVGHIFRKRSPYKWLPGVNVVKKNSVRVAEVWLDEYKKFYYQRFNFNLGDYGDVSSRKLLRKNLQCKSFKWYLTEIFPELYIPDNPLAEGEIRSSAVGYCVDGSTDAKSFHKPVIGYGCHGEGGNQYFLLSKEGEIRRDEGCLDYSGGMTDVNRDDKVIVFPCHGQRGNQHWIYNETNQLYHSSSQLCLTLSVNNQYIQMQTCNLANTRQKWLWKRRLLNATSHA